MRSPCSHGHGRRHLPEVAQPRWDVDNVTETQPRRFPCPGVKKMGRSRGFDAAAAGGEAVCSRKDEERQGQRRPGAAGGEAGLRVVASRGAPRAGRSVRAPRSNNFVPRLYWQRLP